MMLVQEKVRPFVSVVIPVYNDPERLRICLQALEKQTYPKSRFEVIVVDNGSGQSIEPVVNAFASARSATELKRGSYAARNKGISLARGHILAFTDSDCIPAFDWIQKGMTQLFGTENCGLLGGKVQVFARNPDDPTIYEHHDRIIYFQQEFWINQENYSATANLFTFRSVIEDVGTFNPELKSLGDFEWCRRVCAHGYKLVYGSDVCVRHPARRSWRELYKKTVRVAGGVYDLQSNTQKSFFRSVRAFARGLLPSYRNAMLILSDTQLKGAKQRMQLLLIDLFLRHCRQLELLRLALVGRPRNC